MGACEIRTEKEPDLLILTVLSFQEKREEINYSDHIWHL